MAMPHPYNCGVSEAETLYAEAWARYGSLCLWNMQRAEPPTAPDLRGAAHALRHRGDMAARRLAERLEKTADAA